MAVVPEDSVPANMGLRHEAAKADRRDAALR